MFATEKCGQWILSKSKMTRCKYCRCMYSTLGSVGFLVGFFTFSIQNIASICLTFAFLVRKGMFIIPPACRGVVEISMTTVSTMVCPAICALSTSVGSLIVFWASNPFGIQSGGKGVVKIWFKILTSARDRSVPEVVNKRYQIRRGRNIEWKRINRLDIRSACQRRIREGSALRGKGIPVWNRRVADIGLLRIFSGYRYMYPKTRFLVNKRVILAIGHRLQIVHAVQKRVWFYLASIRDVATDRGEFQSFLRAV
jgi:hypothetical protein